MKGASHLKGKVELEYRPEQIWINYQLGQSFKNILMSSKMERSIIVSHPEIAPKDYETKVDNHFHIMGPNHKEISLCIDLHGSWHEKKKVQVKDQNKRLALEYGGHHYIEFRNYEGAVECPALWELIELNKNATKHATDKTIEVYQQNINRKQVQAQFEISNQLLMQLALSRPREISPTGIID